MSVEEEGGKELSKCFELCFVTRHSLSYHTRIFSVILSICTLSHRI